MGRSSKVKQAVVRLRQIFVAFAGALLHLRSHKHKPWAQASIRSHNVPGVARADNMYMEHAPHDLFLKHSP